MGRAGTAGLDPDAAIDAAMNDIRDGRGYDTDIAFASEVQSPGRLSTGSAALDHMLDGGVPLGRITHIPGLPGSGRTTLVYTMIAQAQANGQRCAYIDADHRFNGQRAQALGVDTGKLVLVKPRTIEGAFAAIERLAATDVFALIVLDSLGSTTPVAEYQGDYGDSHAGLLESRVEQGLRKLLGVLNYYGVALVVTNQFWTDPKVLFGSGQFAPGGVDRFATLTLELRRMTLLRRKVEQPVEPELEPGLDTEAIIANVVAEAEADAPAPVAAEAEEAPEPEKDTYGIRIRVKVTHSSDGPAYQQAHVHIVFDEGISREGDLVELGVALGILTRRKGSAKIFFGETLLGKLEEGAAEFLRDHCEIALTIEAEILAAQN